MPLSEEQRATINEKLLGEQPATINTALGIEFTDFDIDAKTVTGTMPVNQNTVQPYGVLHGGASVVLAESLGSAGSAMLVMDECKRAFGLEVNANHVRPVAKGDTVTGVATLEHAGRTIHVWTIRITNSAGKLTCLAKLTVAIR